MRHTVSLFLSAFILTACGGGVTVTQTTENAPTVLNKTELLSLVNQARSTNQTCGGTHYPATGNLQWNTTLEQAAQNHSNDMNINNFFSHTSSNGETLLHRLNHVGHNANYYGENIAKGYPTEQSVVEGWLNSSGHCQNLMNPNYRYMGVATAGPYWTQVFAK